MLNVADHAFQCLLHAAQSRQQAFLVFRIDLDVHRQVTGRDSVGDVVRVFRFAAKLGPYRAHHQLRCGDQRQNHYQRRCERGIERQLHIGFTAFDAVSELCTRHVVGLAQVGLQFLECRLRLGHRGLFILGGDAHHPFGAGLGWHVVFVELVTEALCQRFLAGDRADLLDVAAYCFCQLVGTHKTLTLALHDRPLQVGGNGLHVGDQRTGLFKYRVIHAAGGFDAGQCLRCEVRADGQANGEDCR